MYRQCFVSFELAGLSLTEFGLKIPSPFCGLSIDNSEIDSYTKWSLSITVGGNSDQKMNVAAFEALIYSAAQTEGYANASGIPVSFIFGWLDPSGSVESYMSYQGWSLTYNASTSGVFMKYTLTGYASQAMKTSMPVLNIPAVCGYVQPSAVLEGLAKAIKADSYYDLDIDHSDAPTLVSHNAMTTSFNSYVKGNRTGQDDYDEFPGLLTLSKSYNAARDAAGLTFDEIRKSLEPLGDGWVGDITRGSMELRMRPTEIALDATGSVIDGTTAVMSSLAALDKRVSDTSRSLYHKIPNLSTLKNNLSVTPIDRFLKPGLTDLTPQINTFSFWVDEPTMTKPGIIHYKSSSSLLASRESSALTYGTSNSNVMALSGSYNGVAYNMTDMKFSTLGFNLDQTGSTILNDATVVNSWSSSLEDVYRTASIINDINALATQFSGDFTVQIAGSTKAYQLCEPVSLIVMSGNTLSPISGVYNITRVSHSISTTFITSLKLTRLAISSANQTAAGMGIYQSGSTIGYQNSINTTKNIKSTSKVDFGILYPTWEDIQTL